MDERRGIAELLSDAAADPPSATFDESDVANTARAVTRRRRGAAAGAALAGVVLVAGGVAAGTALVPDGTPQHGTLAGPSASAAPREARSGGGGASAMDLPNGPSLQGDGPGGTRGTAGRCRSADRELADALAGELPSAAPPARPGFGCPPGARYAAFTARGGVLGALLVPAGSQRPAATGPMDREPPRARHVSVRTASGASLYLVSEPSAGTPATGTARLRAIAERLAARF